MSVSVSSMMETRTSKASAAQHERDQLVGGVERKLKDQV
jgi:hypothetical protein